MKRFVCALTAVLLCLSGAGRAAASDPKKELEDLVKKIESNKDKAASMSKLAKLYTSQLESLEDQIDTLEAKIASRTRDKLAAQARLKTAEEALLAAEEETARYRELNEQRLVAMYMNGTPAYLTAVGNAESIGDMIGRLSALAFLADFDRELLDKLRASQRLEQEKRDEIQEEYARIKDAIRELEAAQKSLDAQRTDKEELLGKARTSKAYIDSIIAQEEKDAEELRKKIASSGSGSYKNDFSALIWPLAGKTYISSKAGWRTDPITGARSYHKGTDIPAAKGTAIKTPGSGKIVDCGYNTSYGYYTIIDLGKDKSGKSWKVLFAHQSKILVKTGQKVSAGDKVGEVGSTGRSTGPHLHFELIINGEYRQAPDYITPK